MWVSFDWFCDRHLRRSELVYFKTSWASLRTYRRHGIASAHGLTIRLNPWVRALAAIRVVDALGGQAMPSLRLGSWPRLPTRYGTGTGS